MTGAAELAAYVRLRPGGTAWLAAWQADDSAAADELHEWELEGHPWSGLPPAIASIPCDRRSTMTTIEAVRTLLASPESWCKGATARDAAGQPVPAESPDAVAWCLRGAIARVGGGEALEKRLLDILRTKFGRPGLIELSQFNDDKFTGHADVLEVLCRVA